MAVARPVSKNEAVNGSVEVAMDATDEALERLMSALSLGAARDRLVDALAAERAWWVELVKTAAASR